MIDKKKIISVFLVFFITFLLFTIGCSVVFKASLNGTLVDIDDDNGINNATVLVYTDENSFNNDWNILKEDSTNIESLSNYYAKTTTDTEGDQDGYYNFSGIVWQTLTPQFGKDADRIKVYFIFWHEDYEPLKFSTYLTSDVTNSLPPVKATKAKNYSTIKGSIVDANTNNGVQNVNVRIYIPYEWDYDENGNLDASTLKFHTEPDYTLVTDANGEYSQKIAFIKNPIVTNSNDKTKVIIRITFDRNGYKIDPTSDDSYDDEGNLIDDGNLKNDVDMDGDNINDIYYQTDEIEPDTTVVLNDVPIKRTHFTETISGRIYYDDSGTKEYYNGLTVKIWTNINKDNSPDYSTVESDFVTNTSTRTTNDQTQDGYFSFNNISWDDEDYSGNQSKIYCHILIDDPQGVGKGSFPKEFDIEVYSDANNYFELKTN